MYGVDVLGRPLVPVAVKQQDQEESNILLQDSTSFSLLRPLPIPSLVLNVC